MGMEATKTLVDQLDNEMENIKKEQKDAKIKQAGDKFRTQMDIWKLNQTKEYTGLNCTRSPPGATKKKYKRNEKYKKRKNQE